MSEIIKVKEIEIQNEEVIEIDVEEGTAWVGGDVTKHYSLDDRDATNQHTIGAITNLESELDALKSLKTVYSDKKQQANYYVWYDENRLAENRNELFVSFYSDTGNITICNGNMDVFGVTVAEAGFIGGQECVETEKEYADTFTSTTLKHRIECGREYALVVTSGLAAVRREHSVQVGDYVVPNEYGVAKKSDGNYGYLVTALSEVNKELYAIVSLTPSSTLAKTLADTTQDLSERMKSAEYNIVSVANVANSAYAMAHDAQDKIDTGIEYIGGQVSDALDRMDAAENTVGSMQEVVNSAYATATLAQAIANGAVSSAETIRSEAVKKANEALNEATNTRKDFESTAETLNGDIQDLKDEIGEIGGGLNGFKEEVSDTYVTRTDFTTFQTQNTEAIAAVQKEASETYATISSVTSLETSTSKAISGLRQEVSETYATNTSLAQLETDTTKAITASKEEAAETYATKTELTSFQGETNTSMSELSQKADVNGAYIQGFVSNINKYSYGPYSQAHNFTYEEALNILEIGTVYVPDANHSVDTYRMETYEETDGYDKVECGFLKGYYYTWQIDRNDESDNPKPKWIPSPSTAVAFSSTYVMGNDTTPYWVATNDITVSDGTEYEKDCLYKWDVRTIDGIEHKNWIKVASLQGNISTVTTSIFKQTSRSINAAVTDLNHNYAGLEARLEDTKSLVQSSALWAKGSSYNPENAFTFEIIAPGMSTSFSSSMKGYNDMGNSKSTFLSKTPSQIMVNSVNINQKTWTVVQQSQLVTPIWEVTCYIEVYWNGTTTVQARQHYDGQILRAGLVSASDVTLEGVADGTVNFYNLATIKQEADADGSSLALVVADAEGNKILKGASIVLGQNDEDGSSISIDADCIVMTGTTSFLSATDLETSGATTINGDNITTGTIKSQNNVMEINLDDGTILSTNFNIDSSGNVSMTGVINATAGGQIGKCQIVDAGFYGGHIYSTGTQLPDAVENVDNWSTDKSQYTIKGTYINLNKGSIHSPNFAIDANGNAYFKGTLEIGDALDDKITQITENTINTGYVNALHISALGTVQTGILQNQSYQRGTGTFANSGMQINLSDSTLYSKHFVIDSEGDAYFSGNMTAGIIKSEETYTDADNKEIPNMQINLNDGTLTSPHLTITPDAVTFSTDTLTAIAGAIDLDGVVKIHDLENGITTIDGGWITAGVIQGKANGMQINLDNGTITSTNFTIDNNGNASIVGDIQANTGSIGNCDIEDGALKGGTIISNNYTMGKVEGLAGEVQTAGMKIDLYNGSISTVNFALDSNGYCLMQNANINGTITANSGKIGGLTISSQGLSSGSDGVTFDKSGFLSAQTVKALESIQTSKLVGTAYDSTTTIQYKNVTFSVASDIQSSGLAIYPFIFDSGQVNITVTASEELPSATSIYVKCILEASDIGSIKTTTDTYTIIFPENTLQHTFTINYWDMRSGYLYAFKSASTSTSVPIPDGNTTSVTPVINCTGSIYPTSSSTYALGESDAKWSEIWCKNGVSYTSDRNEKNSIESLSNPYDVFFDALQPVRYKFNQNESNRYHVGFIAQDVYAALSVAQIPTSDFAGYLAYDKDDGTMGYGLRYGEFIALNTYEIQKLKKQVTELERRLAELEAQQND